MAGCQAAPPHLPGLDHSLRPAGPGDRAGRGHDGGGRAKGALANGAHAAEGGQGGGLLGGGHDVGKG